MKRRPSAAPSGASEEIPAGLPALLLDGHGTVVRAAPAACRLLGRRPADVVGRPLRTFLRFASPRDAARAAGGSGVDAPALPAAKDGVPPRRLRVVSGRIGPGILVLVLDDGALPAALEARDRARLEHQTFLRSVSHDLRVPLASAAGYASLLGGGRYREALGADGAYFLARLKTNVEQMDEMLHHLLELSRVGASPRSSRRVRMRSVVDKVIEQFAPKIIETGGQVRVAPDLPDVSGDEIQIRRVFQNLVDNAVKYRGEPPLHLEIGYERDGEGPAFTVRDNGIGIPEAFQPKIWEPFKKLDPNKPGSGVGLSLVKRIVEEHGGRIWVRSTPGKGSTFFVDLPLAAGAKPGRRGP